MRIPCSSLALLLALQGPAAHAQEFDPDLVDCLALTYIALSQAETDLPTATDGRVAEFVTLLESVSAGISHMIAEQTECQGSFDEMVGVVVEARNQVVEDFQNHFADSSDPAVSYSEVILNPMRACHLAIGEDQIAAANADRLSNGYACGWGN